MNVMSRDFTTAEKLLLVLLVLVLIGLGYYYFVDQPIRASIKACAAESEEYENELLVLEQRIEHLKSIQSSMDALVAEGNLTWMGSYNNSKAEVRFLNDILADTLQYSVSFDSVSRSGNQIRRRFSLRYLTQDYHAAQQIVTRLCGSENRCLVSDVSCHIADDGKVTVNQTATFFETMVGGTPDAGLPADSAAANS